MSDETDLELRLKKRSTPPYWWPETQTIMQIFLAVSIVSMVAYIIMQLLSGEALKIDPTVRDLIVFIFGIIFGNFKDVYGFTYGSSASVKSQGDMINRSLDKKDKIIAEGVASSAATAEVALKAATSALPPVNGLAQATTVTTVPTDIDATIPTTTTVTTSEPKT